MFAVLTTGGKQYKVSEGDVIQVEKLDHKVGDKLTLDQVLMAGEGEKVDVGSPYLKDFKVDCEVTDQSKGPKIIIFKKKRRKKYRRKNGHRQLYTELKVTGISRK
ncbi:MAG: 50S ribosomal protein L21 [Nitrospinaceae bacterium]